MQAYGGIRFAERLQKWMLIVFRWTGTHNCCVSRCVSCPDAFMMTVSGSPAGRVCCYESALKTGQKKDTCTSVQETQQHSSLMYPTLKKKSLCSSDWLHLPPYVQHVRTESFKCPRCPDRSCSAQTVGGAEAALTGVWWLSSSLSSSSHMCPTSLQPSDTRTAAFMHNNPLKGEATTRQLWILHRSTHKASTNTSYRLISPGCI